MISMLALPTYLRASRIAGVLHRCLGGVLVLATGACAEPSGLVEVPEEQLIFVSDRDGPFGGPGPRKAELYRIDADGEGLEQLTWDTPYRWADKSLSPDGSRILFSTYPDCDIGVVNVDGTNPLLLTEPADRCNASPRWSPDGSSIAFASNRDDPGSYSLYLMDANGSDARQVIAGESIWEVVGWSPGGHIVYNVEPLTPDNSKRHVLIVNPDGTGLRPLFEGSDGHSPAWSPDGSRLAFIREHDGRQALHISGADGSGERVLTHHQGNDRLSSLGGQRDPWSPDGSQIVFWVRTNVGQEIYVVRADGTGLTKLAGGRGPVFNGWSPRGDRIAFTESVPGTSGYPSDVFVIDADGTGLVNITNHPFADGGAVWLR